MRNNIVKIIAVAVGVVLLSAIPADAKVTDGGSDAEMFAPSSVQVSDRCTRIQYDHIMGKNMKPLVEVECK